MLVCFEYRIGHNLQTKFCLILDNGEDDETIFHSNSGQKTFQFFSNIWYKKFERFINNVETSWFSINSNVLIQTHFIDGRLKKLTQDHVFCQVHLCWVFWGQSKISKVKCFIIKEVHKSWGSTDPRNTVLFLFEDKYQAKQTLAKE